MNKFLSWLAISFGIIYFFYETWYHISYDQSNLALIADYVSIFLLLIAGIINLRSKKGIGLLSGAWGIHLVLYLGHLFGEWKQYGLMNFQIMKPYKLRF